MIITDPWVVEKIAPGNALKYACEIIGAAGVLVVAKLYMRWKIARRAGDPAEEAEPAK